MIEAEFRLDDSFVEKYKDIKPPFGFNGLGEMCYLRTYSRPLENGTQEQWYQTLERVVNGTYRMQEKHIKDNDLGWNKSRAQKSAQEMFDRLFHMKFLPPGRGLANMGTALTEEKGLYACLLNCAAMTTKFIKQEFEQPFTFVMDASMLGIGVGFDTLGAKTIEWQSPSSFDGEFVIPDSRIGWVDSLKILLRAYMCGENLPIFNYGEIRKAGEPIKGFGGVSSGHEPLEQMHISINDILKKALTRDSGKLVTSTDIVDIMNLIGKAIVSGNIRRTALISVGLPTDEEFLDLKDYEKNAHRASFGWTSNNSVFAKLGMDYTNVAKRTVKNGEPGYIWLENINNFGRMDGTVDKSDCKASLINPCAEQPLEGGDGKHWGGECCNICEVFPDNHTDLADFKRTLKFAYLYAKTVTLGKTPWTGTNRIMLRNRRIGCSLSGIAQFISHRSLSELIKWCQEGYDQIQYYDKKYSDWLCIPQSNRKTTNKPSGSVSLIPGSTPGIHFPESNYYIRRMRLSKLNTMVSSLVTAGYKVEPCFGSEETTVVVEIPVSIDKSVPTLDKVSMWKQLAIAAIMQKYWSDNAVSVTVTFDPETESDQIKDALDIYQYQLKSVSFLPRVLGGAFPQMPYEAITEEKYNELIANLKPINFSGSQNEELNIEKFCDGDKCSVA